MCIRFACGGNVAVFIVANVFDELVFLLKVEKPIACRDRTEHVCFRLWMLIKLSNHNCVRSNSGTYTGSDWKQKQKQPRELGSIYLFWGATLCRRILWGSTEMAPQLGESCVLQILWRGDCVLTQIRSKSIFCLPHVIMWLFGIFEKTTWKLY